MKVLDAALKSVKGDIGDIDLGDLAGQIKSGGTGPIDVISLREPVYDKIRSTIHELAGLYFSESDRALTPTPTFAKALIGRVGEVTKEIIDKNPGRYLIGDQVGLGGLQQQYDAVLGGSPGVSVVVPGRKDPQGNVGAPTVLFKSDPSRAGRSGPRSTRTSRRRPRPP